MSFFISDAYAAAPAAQQGDPMMSMIFFVGMIAIFYFILIRPQQKKNTAIWSPLWVRVMKW